MGSEPHLDERTDRMLPGAILFVGGGNMASAIIGGLRRTPVPAGGAPMRIAVVDPSDAQRANLARGFDVEAFGRLADVSGPVDTVLWAVKPQQFAEASAAAGDRFAQALHLSVMAGVRRDTVARATGSRRIVRAMPNTPALIGHGVTGLSDGATAAHADAADRARVTALLESTGQLVWLDREDDLDAVTAVSGSGPAYVFYLLEAMIDAAERLGLAPHIARQLALGTAEGAVAQALRTTDPLADLRQRVTSKGGTTHAALTVLEDRAVAATFVDAITAAAKRARELGAAPGA